MICDIAAAVVEADEMPVETDPRDVDFNGMPSELSNMYEGGEVDVRLAIPGLDAAVPLLPQPGALVVTRFEHVFHRTVLRWSGIEIEIFHLSTSSRCQWLPNW